ncbi:MAG: NAD(P)-dependent oxidoreductase, partial [Rhodospirillales bacterium]
MALLFSSTWDDAERWRQALARELPGLDFREWSPDGKDVGEPADIDYALVWKPEPGMLTTFPNLKAIFSLGAGVDHLRGTDLPAGVPVVRLVDPGLTAGMSEYVVHWVLHHHRRFGDYARQQAEKRWQPLPQTDARARRVGIMGLGVMGRDAVAKLKPFGFDLAGWSRRPKEVAGVETFHGAAGRGPVLAGT